MLTKDKNGEYVLIGASSTLKTARNMLRQYMEGLIAYQVFIPSEVAAFIHAQREQNPNINTLQTLRRMLPIDAAFFPGAVISEIKEKKRVAVSLCSEA